jgi:hypothetical protein
VPSEKVLVMPSSDRKPLRSDENPPYPEFAVELVREFTKTISVEISPIRADVAVMKHSMDDLKSQTKTHGEKLEEIIGIRHTVNSLETASKEQGGKIKTIEGHTDRVKGIVWAVGAGLAILSGVSIILELVWHFH